MKILLSCFEPFAGDAVNPAREAVARLPGRIGGAEIARVELPVVFGAAERLLTEAIASERPDAVLCVGQAGGAAAIRVERVAINVDDARIPDNAGAKPEDLPIVSGGPAAYFSTLPIKRMVRAIRESGADAEVSNSAGTYVCNHVFYCAMRAADAAGIRAGFVHVPFIPEQTQNRPGAKSMPLETIARALEAAVECVANALSKPGQ